MDCGIRFSEAGIADLVSKAELDSYIVKRLPEIKGFLDTHPSEGAMLDWRDTALWNTEKLIRRMESLAGELRLVSDVFVLVGVGGSKQGARAAISALGADGPEIVYAGNTLSQTRLRAVLASLEGKRIAANVIAKNFETLEPGLFFRLLRPLIEVQNAADASPRVVCTGTPGASLERFAAEKGYAFLPFPPGIGGRFSVMSPVGLFPCAMAGLDIREMVRGASETQACLDSLDPLENPSVRYAASRNLLLEKGFSVELLSTFDTRLEGFADWWLQLFGESEGKGGKGIFPAKAIYSEDLHAIGQYVQEGKRFLMETFLRVEDRGPALVAGADNTDDGFSYLEGKSLAEIEDAAYAATWDAHRAGGVPCMEFVVPALNERILGSLFYLFETAVAVSGTLLRVDPFDQPGVEAYKRRMFSALRGTT